MLIRAIVLPPEQFIEKAELHRARMLMGFFGSYRHMMDDRLGRTALSTARLGDVLDSFDVHADVQEFILQNVRHARGSGVRPDALTAARRGRRAANKSRYQSCHF